jgi:autotransporter-associated beta strand protein
VSEFQGQSNVAITGGGTLSTKFALLAGQSGGSATVTVNGATWNNANDLNLGGTAAATGGTATLAIQNGGSVAVGGTLNIYQGDGTAVQVAVGTSGAAASLTVGGLFAGPSAIPRVDLANAGSVLTITDGLGTTYTGLITGVGQVVKQGTGATTLTGNSNYSGGTTVQGGSLFVNGQSGANSGTGTGPVSVAGGRLGGTGRVGGSVSATGGQVAPGTADTGVLTVGGGLTFGSSATFTARLNGATPGTGYDQLVVQSGTVDLGGAMLSLSFGFTPAATDRFVILRNDGAGPTLGEFAGFPPDTPVVVGTTTVYIYYDYDTTFQSYGGGNDVIVQLTPAPEPGTVLGLAAGGLGLARLVRRRARSAA